MGNRKNLLIATPDIGMCNILYLVDYSLIEMAVTKMLKNVLGDELQLQVVHSFTDMEKILVAGKIKMLVIDLQISAPNKISTLFDIGKYHLPLRILLFCIKANKELYQQLYHNGIHGIVQFNLPIAEIEKAIYKVYNNEMYIQE